MFKYLVISTYTLMFLIYVFPVVLHALRTTKNPYLKRILSNLADVILFPYIFTRVTFRIVKKLIRGEI